MSWEIAIPYRTRDDSLIDTISHCRHLPGPGDDRDVARQIVIQAQLDGMRTVAELIDHVEALEPGARRKMIDGARAALGLESTGLADAGERIRMTAGPPTQLTMCAAKDCANTPMRAGSFYIPDVRRWWCPDHAHLAEDGDLEPAGSGLRIAPSGALVAIDPAGDAREAARAESERHRLEARLVEAAAGGAERREYEEARSEQYRREAPPGVPA